MNFKNIQKLLASFFIVLITSVSVMAQVPPPSPPGDVNFSDKKMNSFIEANKEILVIQQEVEGKMIGILDKESMTPERFNELLNAQRNPDVEAESTPEELALFSNCAQQIMAEQQEAEAKMVAKIEEAGLEMQEFQQMMKAYQSNPGFQETVNKKMQE